MTGEYTIAYDPKLKRPGCAIIQAALGATIPRELFDKFPAETWIAHITPDLGLRPVTKEQIEQLIEMSKEAA